MAQYITSLKARHIYSPDNVEHVRYWIYQRKLNLCLGVTLHIFCLVGSMQCNLKCEGSMCASVCGHGRNMLVRVLGCVRVHICYPNFKRFPPILLQKKCSLHVQGPFPKWGLDVSWDKCCRTQKVQHVLSQKRSADTWVSFFQISPREARAAACAGSPGPLLTPQLENQTVTVRVWSFGKHLLKNGCGSVKVPGTERLAGNFPSVFCLFLRIDSL